MAESKPAPLPLPWVRNIPMLHRASHYEVKSVDKVEPIAPLGGGEAPYDPPRPLLPWEDEAK